MPATGLRGCIAGTGTGGWPGRSCAAATASRGGRGRGLLADAGLAAAAGPPGPQECECALREFTARGSVGPGLTRSRPARGRGRDRSACLVFVDDTGSQPQCAATVQAPANGVQPDRTCRSGSASLSDLRAPEIKAIVYAARTRSAALISGRPALTAQIRPDSTTQHSETDRSFAMAVPGGLFRQLRPSPASA